jgi:hypothetical protein
VNPKHGSLGDFVAFMRHADALGIRVIIDPQRVILPRALLGGHVTEHGIRLAIISSHGGHGSTRSTICRSLDYVF